jgi:tetratricopeptide (TPR) repeat protein
LKNIFSSFISIVTKPLLKRLVRPAGLMIFATATMISGCSALVPVHHAPGEEARQAHEVALTALAAEKAVSGTSLPATTDPLPIVALTDELLFKLLTSEIAFQRGNWQAAYITILGVAQQTRDPRLARRAAEMALSAKQAEESLAAIRLWRELAPNSNEATQYYLGFMIMSNNFPEIRQIFSEKLLKAAPERYGFTMLQAQRLLARARDKKAAFDTLEEILSPYKSTAEAHLALAQGAYASADNPRAVIEANAALAIKPDSQLAILTIAQASSKTEAMEALEDFLKKNPDSRDVRLAYASMLIEHKQLEQARPQFEQLLRDKPDDAAVMYTLGILAMEKQQPEIAEKYFLSYLATLEANPAEERDPTPALINLAQIAIGRKDTPAAMNWLAKVDYYDGKNTLWLSVQIRRAQLLAAQGQLKEARQFLNEVKTQTTAEKIRLLQIETQLLRNAKQDQQALQVMNAAMLQFPESPDLLYDFAMLAESQKMLPEMETALRRVIELAPNSQHAYNALGYSFAERNVHLDEALKLIEKALQLAPDDPFILDSLGWVKFRLSMTEEAELALRRAYQIRRDPEIAVHLGEVLWSIGKQEDARKFWHEAKSLDAENASLKSTLLRLKVQP